MANVTRYYQPMGLTPLSEAVDRLFRDAFTWPRAFGGPLGTNQGTGLGLGSNLYETDESYIMQVLLPGVKSEDLEITARERVLTIRGKTEIAAPENAKGVWIGVGGTSFREEVTLPGEVKAESATADYSDGVLTLTLPKSDRAKVRTIKIGNGHVPAPAIEGETKEAR
jgi:HSP20 family protein